MVRNGGEGEFFVGVCGEEIGDGCEGGGIAEEAGNASSLIKYLQTVYTRYEAEGCKHRMCPTMYSKPHSVLVNSSSRGNDSGSRGPGRRRA